MRSGAPLVPTPPPAPCTATQVEQAARAAAQQLLCEVQEQHNAAVGEAEAAWRQRTALADQLQALQVGCRRCCRRRSRSELPL